MGYIITPFSPFFDKDKKKVFSYLMTTDSNIF